MKVSFKINQLIVMLCNKFIAVMKYNSDMPLPRNDGKIQMNMMM